MEKVAGIGGVFSRPRHPEALGRWYHDYLGVSLTPSSNEETPRQQAAGPTVFAPFPAETGCFGNTRQTRMINFRVHNLDTMVRQLRGAGIAIDVDAQQYPKGRFARLHDPEGNPIDLWQPARSRGGATPVLIRRSSNPRERAAPP